MENVHKTRVRTEEQKELFITQIKISMFKY